MCRVNFHGYEISCLIYSSFDSVAHFFFLSFKPKKIIAEKKIFLSVRTIEDGVLYHWIHFYGSPIEAKKTV